MQEAKTDVKTTTRRRAGGRKWGGRGGKRVQGVEEVGRKRKKETEGADESGEEDQESGEEEEESGEGMEKRAMRRKEWRE